MPPRARTVYPLAFLLGALAACGFAPLELWPLSLLCFAGLVGLVEGAGTARRAAGVGWWFALGNFCVGLNWIATAFTFQAAMPAWLGWIAVVLLSIYLAVYPALATAAAWWLATAPLPLRERKGPAPEAWEGEGRTAVPSPPSSLARGQGLAVLLAGVWIVAEWLRATMFTGFAWNPIGVIWVPVQPVASVAALVGTYGLSGLTMLVGGLIWNARGDRGARVALALVAAAILVAHLLFPPPPAPDPTAPLLHIVQPNIGQEEKWSGEAAGRNFGKLAGLTGRPGARPRLVLWPEVAVPALLEEDAPARTTIAGLLGPRDLLMTGAEALGYAPDGTVVSAANSVFGLDPAARLHGRYDKSHLVPYGEYLPMRPILSAIGLSRLAPGAIDFAAGPGPRGIAMPGLGTVGVQICYEIIFSGRVIDRDDRPRFLFNPSNDAWFGRWGPPQHLAQARLRAAEEAMPVARATPTGISAVIDARGRLLARLPWRTAGAIELPLPRSAAPTPFARAGNVLPLVLALFLTAFGFAWARRTG